MRICSFLVVAVLLTVEGAFGQQPNVPPLLQETQLLNETLTVEEGQKWERAVSPPALPADATPVLFIRARVPAGGGCNFIMRLWVNGQPLREDLFAPRLLNKLPNFDPPGTNYHFSWWRGSQADYTANAWMTIFAPSAAANWAGTGRDTDYLFTLPGLISGESLRLGIEHTFVGLAAAMHVERAPLLVEKLSVGGLPVADVARLQDETRQGASIGPVPIATEPPANAGPGTRAYEVVWSGRPEPPAQVTFDNLSNWTAQKIGPGQVTVSASTAQRIWRPRVAEVSFAKTDRPVLLQLKPKQPIPIVGEFDAANLFVYGHRHFMAEDFVSISVSANLLDADGQELTIDLGGVNMGYWVLLHGVLPPGKHRFPMQCTGLQLALPQVKGDYHVYLESLQFYPRHRTPLVRPRPNQPVFPANDRGIMPTPPPGVQSQTERTAEGARFTAQARGGKLQIVVEPGKGCLDGVSARWNGGPVFKPCAGGGIQTAEGLLQGRLLEQHFDSNALSATWRGNDSLTWTATYRLFGLSLAVDLRCAGGRATGTRFGLLTGLPKPRGIEVPYMLFGGPPGGLMAASSGVLVSVLPDMYLSDYSSVDTTPQEPEGDIIGLMKATAYNPLTNGRYNDLRDRLVVSISPEFVDILPNHQNPPSPNRARLAPYMFIMDRTSSQQRWDTLKRYGLDHVIANDFAGVFVKDYSEGFGGRWRPHPDYTIEQVQKWRTHIHDLGFMFGMYLDSTDYYPLNEFWDENNVSLTSSGDLCDAWWGSYMPKTSFLAPFTDMVGSRVKQHYPADCVYLDVSTNRGPRAMDFEAGVPGAGMARAMITGIGDSLVEARKWYGSTISEGIYRWMYAGLSDMDYAQVHMTQTMPVPLDFDLLKLHPYQIGTMMGYGPTCFLSAEELKTLGNGEEPGPQAFYKYVGTSLAYGHMALLGYGFFPPMQDTIQYYALMQGIQKEYLADSAVEIQYHDGERFLPTSAALQQGAHLLGRVRVRYSRGLTVTVNLSPDKTWEVTQDGQTYLLPPYGWVITKPKAILAYSALFDGSRIDYVDCPEYVYLNTGKVQRRVGPLEVQGAAWLKRRAREWRVIPCGRLGYWQPDQTIGQIPEDRGCPVLLVDPAGLCPGAPSVTGLGERGQQLSAEAQRQPDGRLKLTASKDVVTVVLKAR